MGDGQEILNGLDKSQTVDKYAFLCLKKLTFHGRKGKIIKS